MQPVTPSRKCNGCGRIHPGPFFDDNCPSLKKNQGAGKGGNNLISFCSELVTVLCSMKPEVAKEKVAEIKKLLNM